MGEIFFLPTQEPTTRGRQRRLGFTDGGYSIFPINHSPSRTSAERNVWLIGC